MHAATGDFPKQPCIHRAERELAARGGSAGAGSVVEQPCEFGRREIGIEAQPGFLRDERFGTFGAEANTGIGGAAILPHDGTVNGFVGAAIPEQRGLALVGDADGGEISGGYFCPGERLGGAISLGVPEILGLMLNPAGLRIMLRKFALRGGDGVAVEVEDEGARRSRALVERQEITTGHER